MHGRFFDFNFRCKFEFICKMLFPPQIRAPKEKNEHKKSRSKISCQGPLKSKELDYGRTAGEVVGAFSLKSEFNPQNLTLAEQLEKLLVPLVLRVSQIHRIRHGRLVWKSRQCFQSEESLKFTDLYYGRTVWRCRWCFQPACVQ